MFIGNGDFDALLIMIPRFCFLLLHVIMQYLAVGGCSRTMRGVALVIESQDG